MINTEEISEIIKYIDDEINSEIKEGLKANQEKFQRNETLINIYKEASYFLDSYEPTLYTEWEFSEFIKLVKAFKKTNTLASIGLMEAKLNILQDRIFRKNEKA